MSAIMIENPWNKYLEKLLLNEEDRRRSKDIIVLMQTDANIYLIQSIPNRFQKLKDLVLCNNCEIFVSKSSCICHAKLHQKAKQQKFNCQLPHKAFPVEGNELNCKRNNINNNKLPITVATINVNVNGDGDGDGNDDNAQRCSQQDECNSSSSSFIPQSILDTADPLKMTIRLQPIANINHNNNGNIFENLHNYYHDIHSNSNNNNNNSNSKWSLTNMINTAPTDNDKSNENLGKFRRIDSSNCDNRTSVIATRCQQFIPIRLQTAATGATTSDIPPVPPVPPHHLQFRFRTVMNASAVAQSNSQPTELPFHSVHGNTTNNSNASRIIRIRGQPKRVRIQKLSDAPQNWQVMASENSRPVYQNQEAATQRQFQRRLIQQGMISENDIVRCSRSNVEPDLLGPRRKFTIINGPLPRDSRLQVIGRVTPVTNHQAAGFIRVAGEPRSQLQLNPPPATATITNQRHLMFNRFVIARNNSVTPLPQETVTHNPRSRRCLNTSRVELSDEEFILDSQYQDAHNGDNLIDITSQSLASSSSSSAAAAAVATSTTIADMSANEYHKKDNNQSHSFLSNVRSNQHRSDPEVEFI